MEEEDIDKDKSQVAQVAAQGVFAQRKTCNWLLQVIAVAAGPWPGRRGGQVGFGCRVKFLVYLGLSRDGQFAPKVK